MRVAIDENFNHDILRGLLRRRPELDARTVQQAGLAGADDPTVLEWAASEDRILLTQDARTMIAYVQARNDRQLPMPGVIEVSRRGSFRQVLDDLELILLCADPAEIRGLVWFVPL